MERTIQLVQPMKLAERKLLRVAAYARVSCDKDAMEYKCIEDTEFESYFHTGYDYQAKECAVLSNVEFCDELQRLYDRSFERFQYYEYESVSKNPKVI